MDRKYTPDTSPVLPHIPIMPVSYGSAYRFLAALSGLPAPTADATTGSWQGALNCTYHIGGVTHPNGTIHGGTIALRISERLAVLWSISHSTADSIADTDTILLGQAGPQSQCA